MPTPPPLVLLPPSEGKSDGGDLPSWRRGTQADGVLDASRASLLPHARRAGALAAGARCRPAAQRYTGVLYRELDWSTLPTPARRLGEERVRIVSGLWGLVAPDDPIPAYRLKMSASVPEVGRLSSWWRPRLVPALEALLGDGLVWDLLPQEHSAACDWAAIAPRRRVTVRFVDRQGRTVSHWNKLLKGSLVRWILTERPDGPEDLVRFDHPLGYRLDPDSSVLGPVDAAAVLREG